jgi:hypothetical protein
MVGSEKWVARGRSCVRSIIEVGNGMVEFPQGHPNYRLGTKTRTTGEVALMELDGLRCAVKIGIEKGKDGFPDKNTIRQYLSPRPDSETHKTFMRLVNGDTQSPLAKTATAGQTKPSWASAGTKTAPNPAQSPASRPSWAGAAPAAGAKPDKIPF